MAVLNILFIGFHLVTLDFIVNYQETVGETSAPKETSLFVYTLFSFPALILIGGFQALFIWPFSTLGLWCWSKVRPLEVEYYEDHGKEI